MVAIPNFTQWALNKDNKIASCEKAGVQLRPSGVAVSYSVAEVS